MWTTRPPRTTRPPGGGRRGAPGAPPSRGGRDGVGSRGTPPRRRTRARSAATRVAGARLRPVAARHAQQELVRQLARRSGLLSRELTLDQAGEALLELLVRTANGRLTSAEALGHREFVLTRLYESA